MHQFQIIFFLIGIIILCPGKTKSQNNPQFLVDTSITLIDGTQSPYNLVGPGDTVYIFPGTRVNLLIRNFQGSPAAPIIFINFHAPVVIRTNYSYGITIRGCRYVRITGSGDENHFYGFNIRQTNGAGLTMDDMTSDCEIDHVSIENGTIAGMYSKTIPDCSFTNTRDKFTQYNTLIHDNYIDSVGNEGMYIGCTEYSGLIVNCNGKDTLLYPSLLSGVRVYNNIVKYTGWDGIQVSSASSDCQVYSNIVMYDSQQGTDSQMSGITIGGGSKCDCYNNTISEGEGDAIELHGLGGNRIFNNIIVDAGRSYFPADSTKKKYGIFVTDVSVQMDSSFYILFNDIINPKSEGIQFNSVLSKNNLVASNVIINPGDAGKYVVTNDTTNVLVTNNYFATDTAGAGFIPRGYDLLPDSKLIDAGYHDNRNITFDYLFLKRPRRLGFDIGAYENQTGYEGLTDPSVSISAPHIYPNPAREMLTISFTSSTAEDAFISIYNLTGERIFTDMKYSTSSGNKTFSVNVGNLQAGIYIYSLQQGNQSVSGRFIKMN